MHVDSIHFKTIDSTNTWAKANIREFDPNHLTCITAEEQTAGYGRYSRRWVSKPGNLHMTLVFFLPASFTSILINLAQIFAFSTVCVLKQHKIAAYIKWPNDLIFEEKKFAGILVETLQLDEKVGVVMGIGMNVNAPVQTDQNTTSLFEISDRNFELKSLKKQILTQFQEDLEIFLREGFSAFKAPIENLLAFRGEWITCNFKEKTIEGIVDSLTENGQLKIKMADGMIAISSGDIHTLRKKP